MSRVDRIAAAEAASGVSPTVLGVYERILGEILSGERHAGSVVRDADIARELGVSRTPVREALQMLRGVGVIEVLPSRFTRVAELDLGDVERTGLVSLTLYGLVIQEVAASGRPVPLAALEAEQAAAAASIGSPTEFFTHCFRLHDLIVELSENAALRRAIDAVVHTLRLALLTNATAIDLANVLAGQQGILDGLREQDPELGHLGLQALRGLRDRLPLPSTR